MNIIPILFTFDEKLLMPAEVCLTSLLTNADKNTFYEIFILHNAKIDIASEGILSLPERFHNCKISFRGVEDEFVGAYEVRGIPETAYYRLIAPELIPEYDKILYSDVDVIFRSDLTRFLRIDIGDNYFGGVDNGSKYRKWIQSYLSETLKIDPKNGYYYSGNLIINSAQIRKDKMTDKFRQLAKESFLQQDMDIINIACNGRIYPLDPSFCLTNYLHRYLIKYRDVMREQFSDEIMDEALAHGILHFNGPKPWKEICMNMDIWWDYYRRSSCYDEQFAYDFWHDQTYRLEKMPLLKRIKLVARYFREGGRM